MKILFDASVFQQPATGIAKSTLALYQACLKKMPAAQFIALHRRRLSCALPPEIRALRRGSGLPGRLWRNTVLPMAVLSQRPEVVHFPWNGQVPAFLSRPAIATTLHDVLPLSIPAYFKNEKAERVYRRRVQRDIERSALLFTVSEFSKAQILKNFQVNQEPVVIYHAPFNLGARASGDDLPPLPPLFKGGRTTALPSLNGVVSGSAVLPP